MTVTTQGDQIVFGIFLGMTPKISHDEPGDFVALRSIGIAIHPAQESFCKAAGRIENRDARAGVLIELSS